MKNAKSSPSKDELQILIEAFDEIEAGFELSGFAGVSNSDVSSGTPSLTDSSLEENSGEDGDDYESLNPAGYDREEIEVGIDAFLSILNKNRLIRKNKKGRLPSFAQVFELLFEGDEALGNTAREFEDFIEGYFGFVTYEAMCEAKGRFQEIKAILQGKLQG